jgi:hypothetical protein
MYTHTQKEGCKKPDTNLSEDARHRVVILLWRVLLMVMVVTLMVVTPTIPTPLHLTPLPSSLPLTLSLFHTTTTVLGHFLLRSWGARFAVFPTFSFAEATFAGNVGGVVVLVAVGQAVAVAALGGAGLLSFTAPRQARHDQIALV